MDSERFDRLVRSFGQTRSRRQALRTLAGVAAGAVALGGATVEAGRCKNGTALCGKGKNACVDKKTDVNHCGSCSTDCTALPNVNQVHCTNSICVIDSCATGFFNCDGNAGTGCEASSACCTPSCGNGLTCCNGTCTTLNVPGYCGSCDVSCLGFADACNDPACTATGCAKRPATDRDGYQCSAVGTCNNGSCE